MRMKEMKRVAMRFVQFYSKSAFYIIIINFLIFIFTDFIFIKTAGG